MTRAELRRAARRLALRTFARRADAVRAAVRGWRARGEVPGLALDTVRRRLELWLAALYDRPVRVEAVVPPAAGWAERVQRRAAQAFGVTGDAAGHLPVLDAGCVRLPAALRADGGADAAAARYRLLALGQAERLVRGTAAALPAEDDRLVRDLYLVAEGAAADAAAAARVPRLAEAFAAARRDAVRARFGGEALGGVAGAVEHAVQVALGAAPGGAAVPAALTPADALAWARAAAAEFRARFPGDRYYGMQPVPHWGAAPAAAMSESAGAVGLRAPERAAGGGAAVEDARGAWRPVADGGGESPAAPDAAPPAAADVVPHAQSGGPRPGAGDGEGTSYPEWDHAARAHVRDAVTVRERPAPEGDAAWADGVLGEHAALVRRVRARFAPLRARRLRQGRQRRGDEVDLAAYVEAHADRLAGRGGDGDERLYVAVTPARRALAILVLVDVSGSTDAPVDGRRQVIDVEREAVLLAAAALDALGDAYAVLTFSSRGARDVRVATLKGFGDADAALLRRRVGAVRPGANTRLGAAVRHATALLARQPAGHRLLLLLSDGRPNDMDGYQGPRAVEDARQAVHEARARGVTPFCLTVDREAPEYLAHVFGGAGYAVLRRAEQLPLALVGVVRQLLGAGRV